MACAFLLPLLLGLLCAAGGDAQLLFPGGANSAYYQVDACMVDIGATVCDPDCVLSDADAAGVKAQLVQLEQSTRSAVGESALFSWRGEQCPSAGLKLLVLLFKDISDAANTDRKIMDLHWRYTLAHPCEKTAVVMLSPGPDYRQPQQQPLFWSSGYTNFTSFVRYPAGVWSHFYAIASRNTRIDPSELVQLYYDTILQVRQGEYAEALKNIIDGVRLKEQQRVSRV